MRIVEVIKKPKENTINLIRRFTKKVRSTGILRTVRSQRYFKRHDSDFKLKARALKKLERRAEYEKMKKLGKIPE